MSCGKIIWIRNPAAFMAEVIGSRFGRNTFLLIRANVVTQGLLLLAMPILTRLFSPQDFGVAGLFVVASTLLASVASWRFEWSIPSARTEEDAQALTVLSLMLLAALMLALQFALAVLNHETLYGVTGLESIPFASLLPLFTFATAAVAVLSAAWVRAKSMESLAQSKYVSNGAHLVVSLCMGLGGAGALGLVLSYTLAAMAGALILLHRFPLRLWAATLGNVSDLIGTGRRYLFEASISTVVSVVNFAFGYCLPLLLLLRYSVAEVGFYFVAMRIAGGPIGLVSGGISSSFWGEAARSRRMELREAASRDR